MSNLGAQRRIRALEAEVDTFRQTVQGLEDELAQWQRHARRLERKVKKLQGVEGNLSVPPPAAAESAGVREPERPSPKDTDSREPERPSLDDLWLESPVYKSHLTPLDIFEIYADKELPRNELATKFEVSIKTVYLIQTGKRHQQIVQRLLRE